MRSFLATMLVAVVGCTGRQSVTDGIEDPARMVEVVLKEVPVGTTAEDAAEFLGQEGFACTRKTNADFLDRKELEYIYCDRSEGGMVKRRWQLAVVIKDGRVAEIITCTGLVGP